MMKQTKPNTNTSDKPAKRKKVRFKKGPNWRPKDDTLERASKEVLQGMVDEGLSHEVMASRLHMTAETLSACARVHGVTLPYEKRKELRMVTPEREARLREALAREPTSFAALCRAVKETDTVVNAWLRTLQITPDFERFKAGQIARDEKIIASIKDGKSNTIIAKEMNLTKNTVAGVRARAVEAGKLAPMKQTAKQRSRAATKALRNGLHKKKLDGPRLVVANKAPVAPTPPKKERDFTNVIPFDEIRNGRCKFPVGTVKPFMFCGKPAEGPWCPECRAVCFEPAEVTRKKDRQMRIGRMS